MAITTANDETLPNITASPASPSVNLLNLGVYTDQAADKLGNILSNLAGKLVNSYGVEYGQQKAYSDIASNLESGANGDFSHISAFTPVGKAYNDVMDKVAPAVITAQGGQDLQQYFEQVRDANDIPSSQKVSQYAQGSQDIINNYIQNVSPDYKDKAQLLLTQQAQQGQRQMVDHVAGIQLQQQALGAYDGLNKLNVLAQNAASQGNLELTNNYLNQVYSTINAGVDTGGFTAVQAKTLQTQYRSNILAELAYAKGISSVSELNSQLPEQYQLDQDGINRLQEVVDAKYMQGQKAIQINQLRSGVNFDGMLSQAYNGNTTVPYAPLTDEQSIQFNTAVQSGQIYRSMLNVTPSDQQKIVNSNAFNSLPAQAQNTVLGQVAAYNRQVVANPIEMLNLESAPIESRVATLQTYGIPLDKVASSPELLNYTQAYQQNPTQAVQAVESQYGAYAPIVLKQISKATDELGLNVQDPSMRTDYLQGKILPGAPKSIDYKKLSSDEQEVMATLPTNTLQFQNDLIGNMAKARPAQNPVDLLHEIFTAQDGNYVYTQDAGMLTNSGMQNLQNAMSDVTGKNLDFSDAKFRLDPVNNTYNVITSNGSYPIPINIVRKINLNFQRGKFYTGGNNAK